MIKFSLCSESPSGAGSSWSIISTNDNYQLTYQDKVDDIKNLELVMCGQEKNAGYLFVLMPSDNGYYIQLTDQNTNKFFITNKTFSLDEACKLLISLEKISLNGIERIWKSNKYSNNLIVLENSINITFRVDRK